MTDIASLVSNIRDLLSDELGQTSSGIKAIYVEPGTTLEAQGLRAVLGRNSVSHGTPVTNGTYFPNLHKLCLINFVEDKNNEDSSRKMASAIHKVESNFTVHRKLYNPPDSGVYEMCNLYLFLPCISS